jgi:beta-glucanase (GH16 family)
VLAFSWEEAGRGARRFPLAMDASHADGLEFWFHGDGSGREVRVEVLDGRDETRPWELAWSDEFDGPAGTLPDPSVWTPEIGDGTANGIPGWGNAERQAYTDDPANVALDGEGNLVIRALETGGDAPPCYYGAPCEYTSARIITAGNVEVTYGRIEARIKIPPARACGRPSGCWATTSPRSAGPSRARSTSWRTSGASPTRARHDPRARLLGRQRDRPRHHAARRRGFADDFHVYAIDWYPDRIVWSLDGEPYSTVTPADLPRGARWVFDHPHFLILNVAVGGHWPGYPDDTTTFPQEMVIDYVRVYQAPDTSARFEASFRDDTAGWTRVRLPFSAFERAAAQPEGAPDEALRGRELWGVGIEVGGGAGSAMIDEVRWYVGE